MFSEIYLNVYVLLVYANDASLCDKYADDFHRKFSSEKLVAVALARDSVERTAWY